MSINLRLIGASTDVDRKAEVFLGTDGRECIVYLFGGWAITADIELSIRREIYIDPSGTHRVHSLNVDRSRWTLEFGEGSVLLQSPIGITASSAQMFFNVVLSVLREQQRTAA